MENADGTAKPVDVGASGLPSGTQRRSHVVSTAVAAAVLMATIIGCGNTTGRPTYPPPAGVQYNEALERDNAELRRRIEALESRSSTSPPTAEAPYPAPGVADMSAAAKLREENARLRARLEAEAAAKAPPPVVLPVPPVRSYSPGSSHSSHASHASHSSHSSHSSHRSSR